MKILREKNFRFNNDFEKLILNRNPKISKAIDKEVKKIINSVKKNGDKTLIRLTKKFDNLKLKKKNLQLNKIQIDKSASQVSPKVLKSFKLAINRIRDYHKKQFPKNYSLKKNGSKLSSRWSPINSIGIYVPGGKASYPSSLIMSIVPAQIAGVKRIVIMTPHKKGKLNPYIMAIIKMLKIKEVYPIGGAQAIAALTYGTEKIKPVDKIFGPGNAYVATAKRQVYGTVGIDLIAGPSEVVIVADKDNNSDWIASDLIAQSEHDEMAQSILITDNEEFVKKVKKSINKLVFGLPKKNIIKQSLKNYGGIIILKNFSNAYEIINKLAPEHLHLQCKYNKQIIKKVYNSGAIFEGKYSAEALGDYIIGTNHILPTNRTSRFSSGLNVLDFMTRKSIINVSKKGFNLLSLHTKNMAEVEGLDAHKLSIQIREK